MSENGDYESVSDTSADEHEDEESGKLKCAALGHGQEEAAFEVLSQTSWLEKICLFVGGFLALLQGASAPLIAMWIGQAINILTTSSAGMILENIRGVLLAIAALALAQFLTAWAWQTCLMWASSNQALRWQLLFLKSDITWFDTHQPAGLAAKLEMDIAMVQIFMSAGLGFLIASLGQFVSGLVVAFLHGWQLTLIVCATLPFLICTGHGFAKQLERQATEQAKDFAKASTVAEESLMGVRTVAAFGTEEFQQRRFGAHLDTARRGGVRSGIRIGIFWGLQNFSFAVLYAVTLWFGGHVLIAGRMKDHQDAQVNGGDVIVVLIALITGMTGISTFSGYAPGLFKAVASAKSLKEMIRWKDRDIEPDHFWDEEASPSLADLQSIEFRSVVFNYPLQPEKVVLSKLSFFISKGQKVAFVGESGCGKSTTIQLILRFYDPKSGEIVINGTPLQRLPVRSWRRMLGYVGQHPVLFATSAMENIKAGEDISDEEAIEAARQAQILDTLTQLPEGLDSFIGAGGGMLSGGQRQRVAIARALARKPKALLLDEATSALDNESERMVQETLDCLEETLGRALTTISIAHRLTTIAKIYMLKEGHVCEQGTHQELMAKQGEYYSMASLQQTAKAKRGSFHREVSSRQATPASIPMQVTRQSRDQTRASQPDFASGIMSLSRSWSCGGGGDGSFFELPEGDDEDEVHSSRPGVLWRLLQTAKPDWTVIPLALLAVLLAACSAPAQAYFFNRAILSFYSESLEEMLKQLDAACIGLLLVGLVFGVGVFLQNSLFTYMQEGISKRLRRDAFGSTLRMDMSFFDKPENQTASLLVSIERHMTRLSQIFGVNLANTIGGVLTCVACLSMGFCGSWVLALVLLCILPIGFGLATSLSTSAARPWPSAERAYAEASQTTTEAVTSIRTVRALRAEEPTPACLAAASCQEHTLQVLTTHLQVVANYHRGSASRKAFAFGFTTSMVAVIYLIGFFLAAAMINSELFDPSAVLLTLFCVVFGVMYVSILAMYLPDSASGAVAAREVFRLIDQSSKIDAVQPEGVVCSLGDGSISLKEVVFYYPHRPETKVLQRISLTIRRGQKVALVGYSGSGKSTVVEAARLAKMDYVLDGPRQWSDLVGLKGEHLSGGQKQRCAIARALVRKPQILLLDEATSDLDAASEALVQGALDRAMANVTSITVAHRLSTIRNSDRIFVLLEGQVIEQGTYSELVAMGGSFAQLAARSL
eukprot:g17596.t1